MNVYIIAKRDLIRHSVTFEIIANAYDLSILCEMCVYCTILFFFSSLVYGLFSCIVGYFVLLLMVNKDEYIIRPHRYL